MRQQCVDAVTKAAEAMGRKLSQADLKLIEDRIKGARVQLARKDIEAYRNMTGAEQVDAAAKLVAQELLAEKVLKKQREALTIQKTYAFTQDMEALAASTGESRVATMFRMLFQKLDGQGSAFSLENRIRATRKYYQSQLHDLFDLGDRGYLGSLFADPKSTKDLMYELYGKDSGNPMAKKAAEALQSVIDRQAKEYRAEGGVLNQLEDWRHPQYTSPRLAHNMGMDQWVAFTRGKLDRSKYLKPDGTAMNEAEMTAFLENAWRSLALDGAGKPPSDNTGGTGALGNTRKAHRQLFFKDADAWMEYHDKLGEKDMMSVMTDHVDGLSSDIATMKVLSHNPQAFIKNVLDTAAAKDALTEKGGPGEGLRKTLTAIFGPSGAKLVDDKVRLQIAFDYLVSGSDVVSNHFFARFLRGYRNLKVSSLLGSLPGSMLPDQGTMKMIARQNRVQAGLIWQGQKQWVTSPSFRENLRAMGLANEGVGEELSRLGERNGATGKLGLLATSVHRLTGATAINTMERSAMEFGLTATWARLVSGAETIGDLHPDDARILKTKGLTDTDWKVWRLAEQDEIDGLKMLTPRSIDMIPDSALKALGDPEKLRQEAIIKLYGALDGEVNTAILAPSALDRVSLGVTGNDVKGEVLRTVLQFKSFPWAYFRRHMDRMQMEPTLKGKVGYAASTMALTTAWAGAGVALLAMARGEDPQDITEKPGEFGLKAFMKGGGLGFYGDLLLTQDQFGAKPSDQLWGPVIGDLNTSVGVLKQTYNLPTADDPEKARDQIARDTVKLLKQNTPFQNLWYTRVLTDRLLFNQMQEMANPGALERMRNRANRAGTTYWWQPGEMAPDRAPDIGKAVGESATQ